jgi:hypothetical protein
MPTELSLLVPDFRKQMMKALAKAKEQRLNIQVLTTVLSPMEQASLWKQGRSKIAAELKTLALENAKAPYLAECLRLSQPQGTNIVTELLPGQSWHQWGEAASLIWVEGTRKINWSSRDNHGGQNGYHAFAKILEEFSLVCCGEFENTDEAWRTAQLRHDRYPSDVYDLIHIDTEMKKRFFR